MFRTTSWARRATPLAVAGLLLIAGCGDDDGGTVVKDAAPVCQKPQVSPAEGKPATVELPPRPVATLEQQDLRPGTGPEATTGKQLTVNYVGVSCLTGAEFDSSWGKGPPDPATNKPTDQPLPFVIGRGQVIKGWEEGLLGMKVGGQRRLVIPAEAGYGASGQPQGGIPPNDTLVFVVDLLGVADAPPETSAPPPAPPPDTTAPPPPDTTAPPTTVATTTPAGG